MGVQRILLDGQRTWTVTGDDHLPAGPVEEYLEFLRVAQQSSPNTVRSYATSLARWWEYLATAGTAWDEVGLPFLVSFVSWLRTGLSAGVAPLPAAAGSAGPSESTVAARVASVLSFYRYHADAHQVPVADRLYRVGGRAGRYVPGLAHLQRGRQQPGPAVRFRRTTAGPVPLLTPAQVEAILDACARQDAGSGQWTGPVRDRLLFAALAETGIFSRGANLDIRGVFLVSPGQRLINFVQLRHRCGARMAAGMSPAACRGVELGHEFAVGSPGGGEFLVAFFQLEPQVGDLLLEVGDLVAEGVDVGGRAEPGVAPGLLAEHLGQAVFELLDTGIEPGRPLVGGEQVGLQRCPGDGRAGSFAGGRRGGFERVDLAEQVAVPVEEGAVYGCGTGDGRDADLGAVGGGLAERGDDALAAAG